MSTFAQQSLPSHIHHHHHQHQQQQSLYTSAPQSNTMSQKQSATSAGPSSNPNSGVIKPKQTKSRNGSKRGVTCGGYKKDFKWRAFGEPVMPATKSPKCNKGKGLSVESDGRLGIPSGPSSPALSDISIMSSQPSPLPPLDAQYSPVPEHQSGYYSPYSTYPSQPSHPAQMFDVDQYDFSSSEDPRYDPYMTDSYPSHTSNPLRLHDLLSPGSNLNRETPLPDFMNFPLGGPEMAHNSHSEHMDLGVSVKEEYDNEEGIEEIIRNSGGDWQTGSSLIHSQSSQWNPSGSHFFSSLANVFRRPSVSAGSPELWLSHFDKQTCGIMSINDATMENPWRTLIWPLAHENPALYHAIASMTAFHMSHERPALRVEGMEHMRRSIRLLASSLGNGGMQADAAMATTLVLAFSESWDRHISTGIAHLRGAKVLMDQALIKHNKQGLQSTEMKRIQFLYNVWVYLDVLARLTSEDDEDEYHGFETVSQIKFGPMTPIADVDPLMGCASTLFPIIGQCANLVRKVRKVDKNSMEIISEALEIKQKVEGWVPGTLFNDPGDPSSDINRCLQTAEAYRWATLLYLHQAVPELPSPSSKELAHKVLELLAAIPISSRTIIVHIFPLLVAGCEAVTEEERQWVQDRWQALIHRMYIGNVDRALEVNKEVWQRRDMFKKQQKEHPEIAGDEEYELSIRGKLHWVSIMQDWNWQVLLG